MFSKILVAIDGSEISRRAFSRAIDLAKQSKAELHVVYVIESGIVSPAPVDTTWELIYERFEKEGHQVIAELVAMFCPVMIISILKGLLSEDLVFIVLLVVGLAFILTHKLWIRNIYKRFMVRRYKNMCSFRATR